mgnify:CR=1 FL=1
MKQKKTESIQNSKSNVKEDNKSVSLELLKSYRNVLLKVKDYFDSINQREFDVDNIDESMKIVQSVLSAGEKLGKNIETLQILEKKVEVEEAANTKIRGGAKLSALESGILES